MISSYTVTREDFQAAQRLAVRRTRGTRLTFLLAQRVMPVLGLVALCILLRDILLQHFLLQPIVGGVLAMVAWLGFWFPVARWWQIRSHYRTMRDGRKETDPVELELTDTEIISRIPGRSEGRFQPEAVFAYVEDEHIALVYLRKKLFLCIPRRALSEAEWQTLRDWLRRNKSLGLPC